MAHNATSIEVPAFDVSTTGDAPTVAIPFAQYRVSRVTLYGASASLATSTATVDLRTSAAGAGTAIVAGQALTSLTASLLGLDATLATPGTVFTAGQLFLRITQGVAPVAGTVKAVIEVQPLP